MDYSGFKRSQNVEDDRTSQAREFFNLLTSPMQMSYHDLTTHPFTRPDQWYEQLYLQNNPPIGPDKYTPLGKQLGVADVDTYVKALRGSNGR